MHIGVASVAGQGVDLVDENDDFAELLAELPHCGKFGLTLAVELAHDGLSGDVDQRDVDLLCDDFGAGGFAGPGWALEEDRLGSVGLVLDPCLLGDLVVDLGRVQSQQNGVLDESFLLRVAR